MVSSAPFDPVTLGGTTTSARAYASLLYVDAMPIGAGDYAGQAFDVVLAATTGGAVYADIDAFDTPCSPQPVAAGTVLWKTQIAAPSIVPTFDGGLPLGVLSTPALDPATFRLYVAAMDAAGGTPLWRVYGLDATTTGSRSTASP